MMPPIKITCKAPNSKRRGQFIKAGNGLCVFEEKILAEQDTLRAMARIPSSFVEQPLWPEFQKLNTTLRSYLDDVTERVISEGIFEDSSDAEVVPDEEKLLL
jgi:hypothetical protein